MKSIIKDNHFNLIRFFQFMKFKPRNKLKYPKIMMERVNMLIWLHQKLKVITYYLLGVLIFFFFSIKIKYLYIYNFFFFDYYYNIYYPYVFKYNIKKKL